MYTVCLLNGARVGFIGRADGYKAAMNRGLFYADKTLKDNVEYMFTRQIALRPQEDLADLHGAIIDYGSASRFLMVYDEVVYGFNQACDLARDLGFLKR